MSSPACPYDFFFSARLCALCAYAFIFFLFPFWNLIRIKLPVDNQLNRAILRCGSRFHPPIPATAHRPQIFRTTSACNPSIYNSFHTLGFAPPATPVESVACALFQKHGGYTPLKRNSSETLGDQTATRPCCRSRRHPNLGCATRFHDPAILRGRFNLN